MSFIDARLLDKVAYGLTSSPTWQTTRVALRSGRVKRNAERSLPLHRFKAPFNNLLPADRDIVVATYIACLGPVHSFRFKDWADYSLANVIIGTATGATNETMQLIKPYTFGSSTVNRKITKPVAGITLTHNAISLSHTINLLTGIVTFTTTAGHVIRATGSFDVPVYFNDDDLSFDFETWQALSVDIELLEDFTA